MIIVILLVLLAGLSMLPQLWIRHVMKRHSHDLPDIEGTGGELAAHLVERFKLNGIGVETCEEGADHFDPNDQMVRLSPSNFNGRSLKAVAVAAHEVGHAIQFHRKEEIFKLRSKYLPKAHRLKQLAIYVLWASPVLAIIFRSPIMIALPIMISIALQIISALSYLIVLPEESGMRALVKRCRSWKKAISAKSKCLRREVYSKPPRLLISQRLCRAF